MTKAFQREKMKTVFFSDAIAACDLQVGRQLIELMKVHE